MEWIRGEEIGHGAFASINLAKPKKAKLLDRDLPPLMAVKSCDLSESASLKNEEEVFRRLGDCPHVVRCFGAGKTIEGRTKLYNLLLEYAPGGSLANEMMRHGGKLPEPDVRRYTRSVLTALRHIHSQGFVHCDIKVQNILVFPPVNGCGPADVKVADFGLAKEAGPSKSAESNEDGGSRGVKVQGTPLYMSPEVVNENEYEAPLDIWGLGCAVVEMMTGQPPWDVLANSNMYRLMFMIGVGDEIPIIPQYLSDEGKDFLLKCFVKDPKKRWTAEMLINHPFVAQAKGHCAAPQPVFPSPRSHFDFMDCDSSVRSTPVSQSATSSCGFSESSHDYEAESRAYVRAVEGIQAVIEKCQTILTEIEKIQTIQTAVEKIQSLACDKMPDWEETQGHWFTVR